MKERNNKGQFKMACSFNDWCLMNGHRDWLDLWDYELNDCGPEDVSARTNNKYWFKCEKGLHNSELKNLSNISSWKAGLFCRQCRSFGQWMVDTFGTDAIEKYYSTKNRYNWFDLMPHSDKEIWIKCDNDTHPDYRTIPHNYYSGDRCPVCSNRKIIAGVNDIATTHPECVQYFKDHNDAHIYSIHSGKRAWFKCPLCGNERYTDVCTAFYDGYSCPSCGDGVSFNNKFIYCFLKQLQDRDGFILHTEKVFDWSKRLDNSRSKKLYDFYINNGEDFIIEAHGRQHFEHGFDVSRGGRTVEEEQKNDAFKYALALDNGIPPNNYIVIDCRVSKKSFIVSSIMDSDLPRVFNFTCNDIDWDKCEQFAYSNMVKLVSDLWSSGVRGLNEFSKITDLATSTVSKYLRQADELGWIVYESPNNKPIICLDNHYVFKTSRICSNLSEDIFGIFIKQKNIQSNANDEISSTHGFHFKYLTRAEFKAIKTSGQCPIYE